MDTLDEPDLDTELELVEVVVDSEVAALDSIMPQSSSCHCLGLSRLFV